MILTISGRPGSGKSTVAKELAKRLGMRHYSMGDLQREAAKERGISMVELAELEEKDRSIDLNVDRRQRELGKNEDNFVIDSRIGFHFIPKSIRIFLEVDPDVGAERIFMEKRQDERFSTLGKTKKEIARRVESEKKRYMKYYNLDHYDMKNYDIMIDTTRMDIKGVVEEVIKKVKAVKNP